MTCHMHVADPCGTQAEAQLHHVKKVVTLRAIEQAKKRRHVVQLHEPQNWFLHCCPHTTRTHFWVSFSEPRTCTKKLIYFAPPLKGKPCVRSLSDSKASYLHRPFGMALWYAPGREHKHAIQALINNLATNENMKAIR